LKNNNKNEYNEFRTTPLYIILFCGIIVVLIGSYLTVFEETAQGIVQPGRYTGRGGPVALPGWAVILTGLALCSFPACQLIKRKIGK